MTSPIAGDAEARLDGFPPGASPAPSRPMRILALTNLYPPHYEGGYELICERMVGALRERGHVVQVLTSDHGVSATDAPEPDVERSLRIHGFFGHRWRGILGLREIERHNNGVLSAALERFAPDVVHVWNMGGVSKSMLLTLQRVGLPVAFYVSDHWIARSLAADVWLRWWNRQDAGLTQRALRSFWEMIGMRRRWQSIAPTNPPRHIRFQRASFCSRSLRDLTVAAGYDVGHGAVIYSPVNIERFEGPPRTAAQPFLHLLFAGRLAEDKGVMTALRAMALLQGKFAGALTICGRGSAEYLGELQRFVEERQLPVTFTSAGADEMPKVYRRHDAFLFTSEWAEPFALTPLEAMACGLPVIATTTGGSAELFRHRENALTYVAGSAEELAERILELAADDSLRAAIAAAGHREVRALYTASATATKIEDLLRGTIDSWRAAPLPAYAALA